MVGEGKYAAELPLTMMGRELEQGRKITMTGGYAISIRALQKDPTKFRRPLPGSEEEIVSQEDYDRYLQASELARGTSAELQSIGDALLTIYAQSGQRAQSREVEFQAEQLAREKEDGAIGRAFVEGLRQRAPATAGLIDANRAAGARLMEVATGNRRK